MENQDQSFLTGVARNCMQKEFLQVPTLFEIFAVFSYQETYTDMIITKS